MTEPAWMTGPPARILLATDLSARCDRALDRAAQLAVEWQAELIALNVLEAPAAPDLVLDWAAGSNDGGRRVAQRQMQRDLAGLSVGASMRIARGDAPSAIRALAAQADCGLIVTGMARNETLGRFLLGSTVERLARTVPQPLLVVRHRARVPYRRILVATDFSESSRHALHAAAQFFPDCELIVYHAHVAPAHISDQRPDPRLCREIEGECAAFLAASKLPDAVRGRVHAVVEHGPLETTLTRYIREHDVELVVMGTHGRSGLMHVLLGSSAARLLDWLPCDTMIVREPRAIA